MPELKSSDVVILANACDAVADQWNEFCDDVADRMKDGNVSELGMDSEGVTLSVRETVGLVNALRLIRQVLPAPGATSLASPPQAGPTATPATP